MSNLFSKVVCCVIIVQERSNKGKTMAINKLTALNRGNPLNSNGAQLVESVNGIIDEVLTSLPASITAVSNRTTTLEGEVDTLQTDLTALTTEVGEIDNKPHNDILARDASDAHPATSISTTGPSNVQVDLNNLRAGQAREWSELTEETTYNQESFYQSEKYIVNIPFTDPTIAPPNLAGRTYITLDGVNDFITLPVQELAVGDTFTFKFIAPVFL